LADQFPSELLYLNPGTFLARPDAAQLERTRKLQVGVSAMLTRAI
tara:strand:+ start:7014 stop:7148 length:135 start_codon:yes stop_codon:yes gene_type:complete